MCREINISDANGISYCTGSYVQYVCTYGVYSSAEWNGTPDSEHTYFAECNKMSQNSFLT